MFKRIRDWYNKNKQKVITHEDCIKHFYETNYRNNLERCIFRLNLNYITFQSDEQKEYVFKVEEKIFNEYLQLLTEEEMAEYILYKIVG
jgi:hypothetical protein